MTKTTCPTCDAPLHIGAVCENARCQENLLRLKPGDKVDKYVIEEKIGEGGMGEVWRARHTTLQKRVAIKILSSKLLAHRVAVTRFQREAVAVNEIQHRNLVDIFDFGELPDGSPYFVMEYLNGCSLASFIHNKKTLSFETIWQILEQVCRGLQAAHERQIIHRDLKPDNIFLVSQKDSPLPFVKILDFGIAKLTSNDDHETLTKSGSVFGTPAYMSPEQCEGAKTVDARSDVYSLGIILFEMLTGKTPFAEKGEGSGLVMAKQIMTPAPKPSMLSSSGIISEQLDQFVLRVLSKKPELRPQTADQLREELQAVLDQPKTNTTSFELPERVSQTIKTQPDSSYFVAPPKTAPELSQQPRKRTLSVVIPVAIALGILVGLVALTLSNKEKSPEPTPVAAPTKILLEIQSEPGHATVSLDGVVLGKTPLTTELPQEEKEAKLSISLAQFNSFEKTISLQKSISIQSVLTATPQSQPQTAPALVTEKITKKITKPLTPTKAETSPKEVKTKETKDGELFVYPGK
jgi:serine/threonine protein kinase